MRPFRRILLLILLVLFLLLFLVTPGVSWASTLEDAARQLASRIAAALPPHAEAVLDVRNLSSLTHTDSDRIRQTLETELEKHGIRLLSLGNEGVAIRVTLSENFEGYVWAAEYPSGGATGVSLIELARPPAAENVGPQPALVLEKDLLSSQPEPIFDLKYSGDSGEAAGREMYILAPGRVIEYQSTGAGWEKRREYSLASSNPWPRDPRGLLLLQDGALHVFLVGVRCTLSLDVEQAGPSPICSEAGRISWPLFEGVQTLDESAEITPSRNYFSGRLVGGTGTQNAVPPFYSAAFLPTTDGGPRLSLFAGLQGETLLYTDLAEPKYSTFKNWGSNLASVHTSCGSGWQVLASGAGDWTEPDTIRAYQIAGGEAAAVSPPLVMPGPVTVLGPLADGVALAVVRNLRTGRYEAYRITPSCNH